MDTGQRGDSLTVSATQTFEWLSKSMRLLAFFGTLFLLLTTTGAAFSQPKRVLIIHPFGREFVPWSEYGKGFRDELLRQSPEGIDLYETSLATARTGDGEDGPFADYLQALFAKRKLDLVVAISTPVIRFVQKNRQRLFESVPAVFMGVEQRRIPPDSLTQNDALVVIANDFTEIVNNILKVLPNTANIAVIVGDSPNERYWAEQLQATFKPLERRVSFTWFNKLSFEQMLQQAAALPPNSAIFFGLLSVDAVGVPHEEGTAMARLRAVTNAPIFSYSDAFLGSGIVGGPLISIPHVSRQAAGAAARILGGEVPGNIKTPPIVYEAPRFDWRELQRWNISESRLPPGSEVEFRSPNVWEQYRAQITAGLATMLLQAGIISWLLIERRRRHLAEAEATNRRREVIRLNRVSTANVLSSSIAHELNQPLGAILSNTEAAQMLLNMETPDLAQIREILSDIVRDEQRAGEIILGLRNLLNNRSEVDLRPSDMNDTIRDVVRIVSPEVASRGVVLRTVLAPEALQVRSDPIHLQQVIINLVMNGMDAMEGEPRPHNLTIRTYQKLESVEVRVSDSGKGIPQDSMTSIFDAFVTTKPKGTGLGLPIARTIVESYGGDIWAENRQRGAMFCFRLPMAQVNPT
jgi:signal transduction histidine kinase